MQREVRGLIPHSFGLDLILSEEQRLLQLPEELIEYLESIRREIEHTNKFEETITKSKDVLNVSGSGRIREVVIISDRSDLTILCVKDGITIVHDTIEELSSISQFIGMFEAINYKNSSLFRIKDVNFATEFRVRAIPAGPTYIKVFYSYIELPKIKR